jgi:hypothetical protein
MERSGAGRASIDWITVGPVYLIVRERAKRDGKEEKINDEKLK